MPAIQTTGHDLRIYLQQHADPYTNYGISGLVFNLGTSWQEFSHQFTTSGFSGTNSDTRLRFWFVGNAQDGDIYWLDNIRLEEVNQAQPTSTPTSGPPPTATPTRDPQCIPVLNSWQRHVIEPARPSGQSVYSFALDVNDDGWDDVLSGAHWYENPKTGINGSWTRHDIGTGFADIADTYDFDGDGDLDLLGVAGGNWPLVWAENDGSGGFIVHTNIESGITIPLPDPIQGVAIAHFTADGPLEIALTWDDTEVPTSNPHGIQMITVPTDPKTSTWTRRKLSDFSRGEELSEADIDHDGDLDLYLGNYWLRNEYPNTTWTVIQVFVPNTGHDDRTFILDVDKDGDLDTLDSYSHDTEGKVAWYEQPDGNPFGTWTQHLMFQGNHFPGVNSLNIGDMDNDGDIDAVAGEHAWSGNLSVLRTVLLENLDGFGGSWQTHLIYQGDEAHIGMGISDFDRDGDLDVSSVGYTHNRIHIYENLSDHNCGTPIPTATPIPTWTPVPGNSPTSTPTPTATAESSAQNISLHAGWNLISSYINPNDPTLETVMNGVANNMTLMKNGAGEIYWPGKSINEISSWQVVNGYQIYMNNPDTLTLTGTLVNPGQTPVSLFSGYNMVSYLRRTAMPVEQALNSISGSLELVKNEDGELYWPEYDINQIGEMQPGAGYNLYLSNGASLIYPDN